MKGTDKFLMILVIGIVLVTVVAAVVAAQRPGKAGYQLEDTPEGVVFNYLLALQQGDYERAYGYLSSDLPGKPMNPVDMVDDLDWKLSYLESNRPSLSIDSSRVVGDIAIVTVGETTYYRGGLLTSSHSTYTFEVKVRDIAGSWKIIYAQDYWDHEWSNQLES